MIKVGDIIEFVHLGHSHRSQGIVIEISGEYCYVCFFDKSINFANCIPYHVSSLTLIASSQ